jgi:MOSC domain-containing protein YiiM/ferredoxin
VSEVGRLLSANVGMPKNVDWRGRTVFTDVFKDPVAGPRRVRKLNVEGDGQGDLAGHGGEQRAVFVYQLDSYRYWERELGRNDFVHGQFGENFTVEGLADDEVCVGDRYRIGDGVFEVTQPRVTCYRVGLRMNDPRIPAMLVSHHRPGFYFRVLEEGEVQAGDEIIKLAPGPGQMRVAEVDALLYLPGIRANNSSERCGSPRSAPAGRPRSNYSLSGPPEAGYYRITVKHERRGIASGYLHTRLKLGDQLDIAAPRGTFILDWTNAPVLLISAGIGATPVLAMLHAGGDAFRSRDLVPPRRTEHPGALVRPRGSGSRRFAPERTRPRVLQPSGPRRSPRPRLRHRRPTHRIRAGRTGATSRRGGIPVWARAVHERDQRRPGGNRNRRLAHPHRTVRSYAGPDPGHRSSTHTGASCTRGHTRSRTHDRVRTQQPRHPMGQRLRQPARARRSVRGPVRWSCRTGVCHTCETTLIAGDLEYDPDPVEPPAEGSALICCSQPRDDLVLDL